MLKKKVFFLVNKDEEINIKHRRINTLRNNKKKKKKKKKTSFSFVY